MTDTLVRESFNELVKGSYVLGTFPFGSTQVGDFSPLSDYDIIIEVADFSVDEETVTLGAIHNAAKSIYAQTSVPLEVSCFTTAQYAQGMHELPTNMLDWLKKQRQAQPHNVIGKDFVPDIVPRDVFDSIFISVDTFVASTRHLLKKSWMQGAYFRPHDLLGLTLEAPHILGRKMYADADDVRRASVHQFISQNFSNDVVELFEDASTEAGRFKDDHFAQEAADLSEPEYDQIVEATLELTLPRTIELLRRMHEEFRESANTRLNRQLLLTYPYVERGTQLTTAHHDQMYLDALLASQLNSW